MSFWKLIKFFSSNYWVYCLKYLIEINDSWFHQCNYWLGIIVYLWLVRDSSAVRRLFVRLAGAVGRQSALHKENSGFATPTLGRHISTFRGYRILFSIWNPYINRFTMFFLVDKAKTDDTRKHILWRYIVTVCVFVRHLFSFYPFYFDFHSTRIIFDVSSGFYLWNINKTTAWHL